MIPMPHFIYPAALLLLLLIPLTIWLGMRLRSLSRARKWTAITLRTIILFCLIAALAGAELVRTNDRLAVFFILDHSNSVPEQQRLLALEAINEMAARDMKKDDEAGVIVFGDEASIETGVSPYLNLTQIQSFVGGEQTDVAGALRLAMAAFPQGAMKRVVLFSDGNETRGTAMEEVKLANASGVEVSVFPLEIGGATEVRVREVDVPARVNADEPFKLQVVVEADQDSEGTLRIYQRLQSGKRLLQTAQVTLHKGDNVFLLPQEISGSGFYEYEATIESAQDTVIANNEGRAFVVIQGEPTVLLLASDANEIAYLRDSLEGEGLQVASMTPGELPSSLPQLQDYGALVLANVSSVDLTSAQMSSIEALVRDMGVGLVMIGGPDTFGAGGFLDTPVERALPVDMDLKERKIMPRGALVLILHTCEFENGNAWAREIGLAALNVLSPQDLMGTLSYDYQKGDSWLYPLQPVGDKHLMRMALNTTTIGDMPSVTPTLREAFKSLSAADAAVKRIVIISDGDPAAPTIGLLNSLARASISVSTICINPHSPSDQDMLRKIAEQTGGNFYFVTNPNNLPQIFTKEAAVVKRGLLNEKDFLPVPFHTSEVLQGIAETGMPQLHGYVVTTPKDSVTIPLKTADDDPLLAHWRYGLGKSVAFTSDATSRWADQWLAWPGYNRFWSQAVRWALKETAPSNFRVDTSVKDGMGYVRIDAVDEAGNFVNFLRPRGTMTGPGPEFKRQELDLLQTGPGLYEGRFPVDERGVYMMNLVYENEDGSQGMLPGGLAVSYSREYEYNTTNVALLEDMAATGGGEVMSPESNPFVHNLATTPDITPIWPMLLVIACCLFPIEIFVRRVVVDFPAVIFWLLDRLRRIPWLMNWLPKPRRMRPVVATGMYSAATTEERQFTYTPSGEGFDLSGPGDGDGGDGSGKHKSAIAAKDAPPQPRELDYTQQLLAAKTRALERHAKRRQGKDKEEDE